jgi:general secretion pathway protein D
MKLSIRFSLLIMSASFLPHTIIAHPEEFHAVLKDKLQHSDPHHPKKPTRRRHLKQDVSLYLDNEPLIDLINFLAAEKEINIILPVGANAITSSVTLHLEDKVSIDEAWDILYTLLDIAGYSMIAKEETYNIVKTTKEVIREAMPLYIVKPQEIPDSDKRIRYLYYFNHIKVNDDPNNELLAIVKDVLPAETTLSKLDSLSNSLLLSGKANDIKALMAIIGSLDQLEAEEKPEVIQLRYLNAETVAGLFNDQILRAAGDANQNRLGVRVPNNNTYFKKVRVVPDPRTNRLIVFGRPQAVQRVKDFIHKYIDVELESGKSILHVYQLQYLDAVKFEPVLRSIVESTRMGGTEQSKAGATVGGTERYFDQVIIKADQPRTITGDQPGGSMQGSNNLIIAARNDDWDRIRKLIEELDIPQPQVIIEVLIADLTVTDIASLGANVRNPLGTGLAGNANFQSSQIPKSGSNSVTFLTDRLVDPTTIQADLLRRAFDTSGNIVAGCDTPAPDNTGCFSTASFLATGTGVLSFNDAATGKTWGIAQVRQFLDGKKVLSAPHLMCTNNTPAEIKISEERLAIDQGSGSTGGTTTQTRKWIPADLSVKITPRISAADTVNLNVVININQFETLLFTNADPNTANQVTRNVTTNANVKSGNILALGGLTRVDTTVEQQQTPLLGNIPIIGWFFKDRTNTTNKNNLTVFISPTIVMPRSRDGVSYYTTKHVQLAKNYSSDAMLFDNLRDPITRWFFKTQANDAQASLDDFIAQDEFIAPTLFDVRSEQRVVADNKKAPASKGATRVAKNEPKSVNSMPQQNTAVQAEPNKSVVIAAPSSAKNNNDLKTIVANAENPFKADTARA